MTETPSPLIEADHETILKILPHRYPFLLIDHVRDVVADKSAVGIKNVTFNEPHFQGHFPGHPVMPGVLVIEAMAQTSAVLIGLSRGITEELMIYFTTVDKAKFRRPVVPGDVLELHVSVKRAGSRIGKFEGKALVNGELAAEAEFSAMVQLPKSETKG
ncbi:3-hydroxyacyl-[acyl-carrier-protein] dehydratase [Aliiruegeria haliotis]|uniref:3-hydroxyacyl-[acyl-carrier-protein] dehydratase FabZ n=1 Tax=Aliiruegeria haliotis TaxID=1280846 RepID=A0A2T0RZS4_9RHOB|nr:3-hydroxyacyl-ACP dehydratase FabZ [Aliiruegeria haliotis]PRY26650.1 3-hydroxyacyl-[acyl-carrier-protein] dehydratase [Aliiruegeria haliotis]